MEINVTNKDLKNTGIVVLCLYLSFQLGPCIKWIPKMVMYYRVKQVVILIADIVHGMVSLLRYIKKPFSAWHATI